MRISDWSSDVCSSDLDPIYRQRASALANAGSCALKAGRTANVERHLREALSLDPVDATALEALAEYQYRNGRYMDARAFSQRRLAAAPATAAVLLLASQIEEKDRKSTRLNSSH